MVTSFTNNSVNAESKSFLLLYLTGNQCLKRGVWSLFFSEKTNIFVNSRNENTCKVQSQQHLIIVILSLNTWLINIWSSPADWFYMEWSCEMFKHTYKLLRLKIRSCWQIMNDSNILNNINAALTLPVYLMARLFLTFCREHIDCLRSNHWKIK